MKTITILSAAMILLTVTASPALADLCAKCKGQMYITSVGKCVQCGGTTSSGAFALCKACSAKLNQCEHCLAALGGAPVVRPPAAGEPNARATPPATAPATQPAKPLVVEDAFDGKSVSAAVGQQIVLRLKGNPTTGYSWGEPAVTGDAVRQEGKERYVSDAAGGRVGAGGVSEWTLAAVKPGKAEIRLEYRRPWEKDKAAEKTFTLTVDVEAGAASAPASGPTSRPATQVTADDGEPRGPTELTYWCDPNGTPKGCGHEFAVKVKDLPLARSSGDELDVMKLDCPKCGAKKAAWQERQCPNCKKFFVALSMRLHYQALRTGRGDPVSVRDVCPWCKTDIQKWYIEHQPKD